jgi:hypothetical protein
MIVYVKNIMGIAELSGLFSDAGTKAISPLFKNNRLQWLPGYIFVAAIILRFPAQDPLFPLMKETKGLVEYIRLYVPFIMKYDVPIINSLFISFTLAIIVLSILKFLSNNLYWLKWAYFVKKWATVSLVLMLPTCVPYASFLMLASEADINQELAHNYHFWFLFLYLSLYLYAFLCHMYNAFYSWATVDSNKAAIGVTTASVDVSAAVGNVVVDATDRGIANRYINEASSSRGQSMRDRFNVNLNGEVGAAYVRALGSGQTEGSVDEWIDSAARSAAIKDAQSTKRENRDLDSSHE